MTKSYLPPTQEIHALFLDEVSAMGCVCPDVYDDGMGLYARAFFSAPVEVRPGDAVQGGVALRLETAADIALWHRLLPCAGRIVSITVKGERATAVFVLANGKNRRCDAPGAKAAAVFRIRSGTIRTWTQVPVPPEGPTA